MSTEKNLSDITLALAGMFQAASLVRDLAKTGTIDETAFTNSINSIYKIDAANTTEIYGDKSHLNVGLNELVKLLGSDRLNTDPYVSRYVISLIHLERKLMRDKTLLDTLKKRLQHAIAQANYFSNTHSTVIASLADIYINTIGKLSFRLHVLGNAKFLNQTEIINKIRALLLAGIRATVLWRQLGGNRWQLFLARNKLTKTAQELLQK